jgi:hypothetical protein
MLSCRAIQIYTAITDESWDTARVSGRPVFARIGISVSVLTIVVAVVGFVVTLILNAFVLDKFDAYGEVPIPGSGSVQLPAGDVTINFHTEVMGGTGGGGLPVPQLTMDIDSPAGAPDPKVTESSARMAGALRAVAMVNASPASSSRLRPSRVLALNVASERNSVPSKSDT